MLNTFPGYHPDHCYLKARSVLLAAKIIFWHRDRVRIKRRVRTGFAPLPVVRSKRYPFPRWRPQLGAKPMNISINAKLSVEREPVVGQTLIDMCGHDRERASEASNLLELRCLKLRPNIIAALQGNRSYIRNGL